VYEAVWGVYLDGANFPWTVVAESGWVIPTGRRARRERRQAGGAVSSRADVEARRTDPALAAKREKEGSL